MREAEPKSLIAPILAPRYSEVFHAYKGRTRKEIPVQSSRWKIQGED